MAMRGYFGIGIEGVSKPINVGNLIRTAHAFGASFVFTVGANCDLTASASDTSHTPNQVPTYHFESINAMRLPEGCSLVGVEIDEVSVMLPGFRHPRRAAYVLGMERIGLSDSMISHCDHLVQVPTTFSLNLATTGGIVMYDRMLSMRKFGERPVMAGGAVEPMPAHVFADPVIGRRNRTVGES